MMSNMRKESKPNSSPAASGAVLSPSHPWRNEERWGSWRGFPLTKTISWPFVNLSFDPAGLRHPVHTRTAQEQPRPGALGAKEAHTERESGVTSRKPTKIHKCQAAPFCLITINVSLKKESSQWFSQTHFWPASCVWVLTVMLLSLRSALTLRASLTFCQRFVRFDAVQPSDWRPEQSL